MAKLTDTYNLKTINLNEPRLIGSLEEGRHYEIKDLSYQYNFPFNPLFW